MSMSPLNIRRNSSFSRMPRRRSTSLTISLTAPSSFSSTAISSRSRRVGQTASKIVDGLDDLRQHGAFAAQVLCVFGVVPDVRVFELAVYFDQTIMLVIVVKDTPE